MGRLSVAVIGVGGMGRRHAENVCKFPELRLVAVADARADVAQTVAGDLDCPFWTTDAREVLVRSDCQAVIIATAAGTHAELVEQAARFGRDVLCEKPLALTMDDARRAVRAMDNAGRRLQLGFMRRYDPGYAAAHAAIAAGRIGRPLIFKAVSRDREPGPSQVSGGIFVDSAIHDFDLARWLMRDEVVEVTALAAGLGGEAGAAPDTGLVTLRFAGGAVGAAEVFAKAGYGYDIRTEIIGSTGTLRIGRDAQRPLEILTPDGVQTDFVGHFLDRFAAAYELEVRDWGRRMLDGQAPAISGVDGLRALEIALAARDAAGSGRVVALGREAGSGP